MPIEPGTTVMFGSSEAAYPTLVTDPFSTPTHNAKDTRNVSGACSGLTQTVQWLDWASLTPGTFQKGGHNFIISLIS